MKRAKRANPGKDFEAALVKQFAVYEVRKIARVKKSDPPSAMRCVGPGQFRPILLENPFLDFTGTWTERGGRMIQIEAKSTAEPRLACPADNGIKAAQIAAMREWQDAGALVAVLWEYRREDFTEMKIVTLDIIDRTRAKGRASIAWADAISIPSRLPHECITADFLSALKQLAQAGL